MSLIPLALDEDAVVEAQPAVRAQLVAQLMELLTLCRDELAATEGQVDIRFAELQLRVLDRVGRLYRLWEKPRVKDPEEDTSVTVSPEVTRQMVLAQLQELENRIR